MPKQTEEAKQANISKLKTEEQLKALTPYEVLGIPENATDAEITKAYRSAATPYHPDKHQKSPLPAEYADCFAFIANTRELLLDPVKRASYDQGVSTRGGSSAAAEAAPRSWSDAFKDRQTKEQEKTLKRVTGVLRGSDIDASSIDPTLSSEQMNSTLMNMSDLIARLNDAKLLTLANLQHVYQQTLVDVPSTASIFDSYTDILDRLPKGFINQQRLSVLFDNFAEINYVTNLFSMPEEQKRPFKSSYQKVLTDLFSEPVPIYNAVEAYEFIQLQGNDYSFDSLNPVQLIANAQEYYLSNKQAITVRQLACEKLLKTGITAPDERRLKGIDDGFYKLVQQLDASRLLTQANVDASFPVRNRLSLILERIPANLMTQDNWPTIIYYSGPLEYLMDSCEHAKQLDNHALLYRCVTEPQYMSEILTNRFGTSLPKKIEQVQYQRIFLTLMERKGIKMDASPPASAPLPKTQQVVIDIAHQMAKFDVLVAKIEELDDSKFQDKHQQAINALASGLKEEKQNFTRAAAQDGEQFMAFKQACKTLIQVAETEFVNEPKIWESCVMPITNAFIPQATELYPPRVHQGLSAEGQATWKEAVGSPRGDDDTKKPGP
jgi:curved DNA-binding protein CbpA